MNNKYSIILSVYILLTDVLYCKQIKVATSPCCNATILTNKSTPHCPLKQTNPEILTWKKILYLKQTIYTTIFDQQFHRNKFDILLCVSWLIRYALNILLVCKTSSQHTKVTSTRSGLLLNSRIVVTLSWRVHSLQEFKQNRHTWICWQLNMFQGQSQLCVLILESVKDKNSHLILVTDCLKSPPEPETYK